MGLKVLSFTEVSWDQLYTYLCLNDLMCWRVDFSGQDESEYIEMVWVCDEKRGNRMLL